MYLKLIMLKFGRTVVAFEFHRAKKVQGHLKGLPEWREDGLML